MKGNIMAERHQFKSTDSNLKHRNGQWVTVTEHITEASEEFDAEVLPMMRVRFADGYVTEVWPDELVKPSVPAYRDVL
jgi:hypothetical protein